MKFKLTVSLFALVFVTACGSSKAHKNKDGAQEGTVYKPGPGVGESCYVGPAAGQHYCIDIAANDAAAMQMLTNTCTQNMGRRQHGTCSTDNFVASCNNIPGGAQVRVRFYQMSLDEAQSRCQSMDGQLGRYW